MSQPVHQRITTTTLRPRFKHSFHHLLLLLCLSTTLLLFPKSNGSASAMTILHSSKKQAIVLVDPLTDYQRVIEAATSSSKPSYHIIAVRMTGIDLNPNILKFIPTPIVLYEAGVDNVVAMDRRDVYSCTHELKLLEEREGIEIKGVVPLSEIAVDVSDMLAASLGKPHNPLETVLCRRDKGFMKDIVAQKGLRVARFARIGSSGNESGGSGGNEDAVGTDGLNETMERIGLDFPVVIKTPQGMSTTDVYICRSMIEAETALGNIVGSIGPDGRTVQYALLEEYIHGTEFAVNLMAFQHDHNDDKDTSSSEIHVTDVWKYEKDDRARYISAEICDPNETALRNIVEYAKRVARAVDVHYGTAHVELKAVRNKDDGIYTDPVMIEVGARLSGGRKAIMATEAVPNWDPFTELIASHCGQPPFSNKNDDDMNCSNTSSSGVDPTFFSPRLFVRHVFLTVDRPGRIRSVQQPDTTAYKTLHSYVTIVGVGDEVRETTDIITCAGFGWLVGERAIVDLETSQLRSEFKIVMEQDEVS